MRIAVSIVIYKSDAELKEAIQSVFSTDLDVRLFLIDNSDTDKLKVHADDPRISYIFNGSNLGYGAAHNIGLRKSIEGGIKYHLVMNPDVSFVPGTLEKLVEFMEDQSKIGALMPKVYYKDGQLQRLCKLLPTPFDLIGRRFMAKTKWAIRQNKKYELHHFNYDTVLNTSCLSGCFMFLRTNTLEKVGLFDEQFFMYMEDYDLGRRINQHHPTIFLPSVEIIHRYTKGSYHQSKLLMYHMVSAIKYFNKWGWFRDKDRDRLNSEVLTEIGESH